MRDEIVKAISSGELTRSKLDKAFQLGHYQRVYSLLQKKWEILKREDGETEDYEQLKEYIKQGREEEVTQETPIYKRFQEYLNRGLYPPPEVLLLLHCGFANYERADGDLSLDQALLDQKHEHKKRYSTPYKEAMLAEENRFGRFHLEESQEYEQANEEGRKRMSQEDLATLFFDYENRLRDAQGQERVNTEAFLKAYQRWKKANGL